MLPSPSKDVYMNASTSRNGLESSGSSDDAMNLGTMDRSQGSFQAWLQDASDAQDAVATGRKRSTRDPSTPKKRKTTYDTRREQKVERTAQVEKMQKQLEDLKYRVLVEQGEAAKSNERVAAANSVLQEFIQEQHVQLANMQAMLAGHLQQNLDALTPAHTIIHLGTDRAERHNTLMALKPAKLQEAKRFITARSRGLDPRTLYQQEERNSPPGEDYTITHFEIVPIKGTSAHAVFNAFIDVAQNAEIVISELFGSITLRENSDADARDVSQMRLVTSTSQGTLVESNTAMFTEFVERNSDEEVNCGLIVSDFVDSDELYPYKPEERVQRDTTTIFMVHTLKQPARPPGSKHADKTKDKATDEDNDEPLIVATRWTCTKIRRSKINLSIDALSEIQESTVSFGDTMKKCIQQRLGNPGLYYPEASTARGKT